MTTTYRNRKQAGTKVGGQFATTPRPGEIELNQPLRLNESSSSPKKPTVSEKVTIKVSGAGQAAIRQQNGLWVNPSFLADKDMRTIAGYDFRSRKGCKEATQLVVTELLNDGVISSSPDKVKEVCREVSSTGHNTTGWTMWPNTGAAASTLHYSRITAGDMQLITDTWEDHRVMAACKTYQYLHEGSINRNDPHFRRNVEQKVGELVFKAGSILAQHADPWRSLEKRLRNPKHVGKMSDHDPIGGQSGSRLVWLAEQRLEGTETTFLEVAARDALLLNDKSWEVRGKMINTDPFAGDALVNMVTFVAANPGTSRETLEACQRAAQEMKSDGHDWKQRADEYLRDLDSMSASIRTRTFGQLAGMIQLGVERNHIGKRMADRVRDHRPQDESRGSCKRDMCLFDMAT